MDVAADVMKNVLRNKAAKLIVVRVIFGLCNFF